MKQKAVNASANDAKVGARSAAQFLRPAGIAPGTGISTFHQLVGNRAGRRPQCVEQQKTREFGKKAEHARLPKQC